MCYAASMDTQRLKIKIGTHEFEAEGPIDVVQSQFAAFKELIVGIPFEKQPTTQDQPPIQGGLDERPPQSHVQIERILKADGRVVSLTARCDSPDEAALLILLGQKELRSNQEATGSEIMDGLTQSGYRLGRVDHLMNKLSSEGSVITMGIHRGRRYRLTNLGLLKALEIAKEVIATVP
jgi:hypothetical protein